MPVSHSAPVSRPTAPPASTRRKHRWLWRGIGLSAIAAISTAAGALLAVGLDTTPLQKGGLGAETDIFDDSDISVSDLRLPRLTRPVNVLVVGTKVLTSDVGQSPEELGYHALVNSFGGLADTIMLVRFDPETGKMSVLSIPRDTRIELDDAGTVKINTANQRGGAPLTAEAVSDLLGGIRIDRYVRVNVQGVEKLIDALGGVSLYVPKDMKYQDDSQHLYINLKAGEQHLDGNRAVQFLRFRHDRFGDIGRVQRQQMMMRAIVEQALSPGTLVRVPQIFNVVQSHLDTNLSVEEILALSGFAARADREDVQMLLLPGDFGSSNATSSYWLPDRDRIRELSAQHFGRFAYASAAEDADFSRMRIAIQDSTDDPRAVRSLARTLQAAGFENVYVSSDWSEPLDTTRAIAQNGNEAAAAAVQRALGIGDVRVESTGALDSSVTVVVGRDWRERARTVSDTAER